MVDRQLNVAQMVAETCRRCRHSSSHALTDTRCGERRQRLGLGHPRIDANHRSTI